LPKQQQQQRTTPEFVQFFSISGLRQTNVLRKCERSISGGGSCRCLFKTRGERCGRGPKIYFLFTPDINFIAGRGKAEASLA